MTLSLNNRRLELALFIGLLLIIIVVYLATFYPDQGWGDDFAQYVSQAMNITRGVSMENTGYIYSRYTPSLGPRAYPPGFPLMLAPVYAAFGFNVAAFQILLLVLQIITLLIVYWLYRRSVAKPTALVLLLMMGLSPYFISFKRDIMSDIPFMLACLGFLAWVEWVWKPGEFNHRHAAIAALLVFICYLVRTIGFAVLLALIVSDLLRTRRLSRFTLWTIIYLIPLVVVGRLLFGGGQESYLDQFANYSPLMVIYNIGHYLLNAIRGFWAGPSLKFSAALIMPILWLGAIPLIIYGFVRRVRTPNNTLVIELFFIFYLAIILIWPSVQELRFLYPILPLFLLYAGVGFEGILRQLQARTSLRVVQVAAALCAVGIIGIYAIRTSDVVRAEGILDRGPYTTPAIELFTFVKDQTADDAIFAFFKPRALALYTGRHASTFPTGQTMEIAAAYLKEIQIDYVIVKKNETAEGAANESLAAFIEAHSQAFTQVFSNVDFDVYQVDVEVL